MSALRREYADDCVDAKDVHRSTGRVTSLDGAGTDAVNGGWWATRRGFEAPL